MVAEYLHRGAHCGNLKQGIIIPLYHNLQRVFVSPIQTLNPAFEWFGICLFYFYCFYFYLSLRVVLSVLMGYRSADPHRLLVRGYEGKRRCNIFISSIYQTTNLIMCMEYLENNILFSDAMGSWLAQSAVISRSPSKQLLLLHCVTIGWKFTAA